MQQHMHRPRAELAEYSPAQVPGLSMVPFGLVVVVNAEWRT